MKTVLRDLREGKRTLKNHVLNWLNDQESIESAIKDLLYGGCQSGMVKHLIYYKNTVRFYNTYRAEIDQLIVELEESTGESRTQLFKSSLDMSDWFDKDETFKKNILAWFGFEKTARNIADELNLEV